MPIQPAPRHSANAPASAVAIAALSVDLTGSASPPTAFRLLPYGRFKAADGSGRPEGIPDGWLLEPSAAAALVAAFAARADARVIDYEHQTLHAETNGQPAPAAGWIGGLEARDDGLYAVNVEWTAAAAASIGAKQYRYISPVFSFDKRTGRVLAVAFAALTNYAGLDGLTDLAALAARLSPVVQPPEMLMHELLKALGLAVTATEAEAMAALAAIKSTHHGELAALKGAAPDPARFVEVATLTAVQGELSTVKGELATLKTEKSVTDVDRVVTAALTAGKLTPAMQSWARKLGASDMAALTAYIADAPVVAQPGATQTGGKPPVGSGAGASLTTEQLAVCKALGLSADQFIAAKPKE